MIKRRFTLSLLSSIIFFSFQVLAQAQSIDTITGFDEIPAPELAYTDVLVDSYDILYGSTFGYTASENTGWCSTVDNDQYISFRASPTGFGEVGFLVTTFGCTMGNGLEVGIYDIHNRLFGACFEQEEQVYQISNLTPGLVYYIRLDGIQGDNCEFNLQFIGGISSRPAPPSVYLGNDTVCTSGCITAPTGETITCNSYRFAFEASNDTTYYGELYIDQSQEIELLPFNYTCDLASGEWIVDLEWIGSSSPFYLNDQTLAHSFGRLGPFASGDTISVAISGSSFCVDTLFTEYSYSCVSGTSSIAEFGFEMHQLNSALLEVTSPSIGWNLSILDILGREVYATPLQRDANQLFVGDLLSGTYFIVVRNGGEMASEKWVKR